MKYQLLGWWRKKRQQARRTPPPPFGRPWGALPFEEAVEGWKRRVIKRWQESDESSELLPEKVSLDLILEAGCRGQWQDVMMVLVHQHTGEVLHEQVIYSIERSSGDVWNQVASPPRRWGSIYGGP